MKVKRMIAMGLAGVMTASMLAGCGASTQTGESGGQAAQEEKSGEGGSEKKVIRFWAHQNEAWQVAYEDMIAKFEEQYPEYDVQSEYYPYKDFETKIQTSLMTEGEGADVYAMWGGWALDFGSTGALCPVPENLAEDIETDFYEPSVAAYRYEDQIYGVPLEYNLEYGGMLVNKKLFEEAGLDYPTTWEELEQVSNQVSVGDGTVNEMRGFDFVSQDSLTYLYLGMILSSGGQYLNEDGSVDFTSKEAVEAMEQLKSYVVDNHWSNMDTLVRGDSAYRLLYEGKSFMHPVGCWAVSNGEVAYGLKYGEDYDYVPLPSYGSETKFAAETGWGLAVPQNSKEQEGAWKFVEFFTDPDNLVEFNIACAQIPPRKSMQSSEKYQEAMPYATFLLDILEKGQWIGPYNTETFKASLASTFMSLCSTDEYASVEEALAAFTDTINQTQIKN